jgi:hypothetical protein
MYFAEYGKLLKEHTMKKWNPLCILIVLAIGMIFFSGCTDTGSTSTAPGATPAPQTVNETVLVTPNQTPTIPPTSAPAPVPVTNQTQTTKDPILGSWLNGMVFNADGTVGSDGTTSWKGNKNDNNSYFVIADVPSEGANNQRSLTATEWIYNPLSDKINMRGSSQTFARGIPKAKLTTKPTATTIRTPAIVVPLALEESPGSLLIHTGGLGGEAMVFIAREGTSVQPIKNVYDAYGKIIESQAAGYMKVTIFPDGNSRIVTPIAPGNYIAYLPDKNGALEPEQKSFTINANSQTVITFSGFSYRAATSGGCSG